MPSLRDVRTLSGTDWWLLFAALLGLSVTRVLLPVAGLDRTRSVTRLLVGPVPPYRTVPAPDRPPWAVQVVDWLLPVSHSCLMRAIACETLLAANGYAARIHLGVANDEEFSAHAWVEYDDEVVTGDRVGLETFQHLDTREYEQ